MKERFKGLTIIVAVFILGVALIAVYKTFDNLAVIFAFFGKILHILSPFVIGLGMAFLLFAPSNWLEKRIKHAKQKWAANHARALSVLFVYLILAALIVLLFIFGLPALIRGAVSFVTALPVYYTQLMNFLSSLTSDGGLLQGFDITGAVNNIYTEYILPRFTVENVLTYFKGFMNFTTYLLNIFMAIIISIYMLLGRESLLHAGRSILELFLPEKWMPGLSKYTHRSCAILYSYLYSQALDAFIVGIIMTIGLVIFHAPNAPLLGFFVGLMNLIPYFGAIIGCCLAVAITLISGNFYGAIFIAIYMIAMQQLDANLIQPRIVSNTVGIKPIYVLLAITLGGGLFGFWGIFFGVPAIAIIQMLLRDYIQYRKRLKKPPISPSGWRSPPETFNGKESK